MGGRIKFAAFCLFIVFISSEVKSYAQSKVYTPEIREWQNGLVVLTSGDTISGAITYHCKQEVIEVIEEDQSISTFSPVNVAYFVVTNVLTGQPQVFRTLYWDQGKDYTDFKKPTFFEQLNEGKFSLVLRETYVEKSSSAVSDIGPYGREYDLRSMVDGSFVTEVKPLIYVMLPDGDIKTLRNVKKDLLRLCGKKSGNVKKYAKKNKLNFDKPSELKAIVQYYNTL